jgi:hypothetical protein
VVTGTTTAVAPTATTTYTLTATNTLGAATTATVSQTVTRYNIFATDLGTSFEDNGKLLFFFGDTQLVDETVVHFRAGDVIGPSTTTDGETGLLLNFFTQSNGLPLFTAPPVVTMGADDVANAGIRLADGVYLVVNTGADLTKLNPQRNAVSILARFDETAGTFTTGRTISRSQGGHFVFTSLHASGPHVLMFGEGQYRGSDVYPATTLATGFLTGTGTQYFKGLVNGLPTWSTSESDAAPVIEDNPTNSPAWPNDSATVSNISVGYSTDLGLGLAT